MSSWKNLLENIKDDVPGNKFTIRQFIISYKIHPGFRVLLNHRIGKFLHNRKSRILRFISQRYRYNLIKYHNCDIDYGAQIGNHIKLPHPIGIIIGGGVIIKDNVTIFQNVTFGSHGKIGEKQYPVVNSGVTIYAGAKIIGKVEIGENAIIGANAVVNKSVPPNSIAVGVPCTIIPRHDPI